MRKQLLKVLGFGPGPMVRRCSARPSAVLTAPHSSGLNKNGCEMCRARLFSSPAAGQSQQLPVQHRLQPQPSHFLLKQLRCITKAGLPLCPAGLFCMTLQVGADEPPTDVGGMNNNAAAQRPNSTGSCSDCCFDPVALASGHIWDCWDG